VPLVGLLFAAFVGALGFTVAGVTWDTSLQTIPVGQLLIGPAASRFGGEHVAMVCGIGYVVATVSPLAWSSVRRLGASPTAPEKSCSKQSSSV
jgi:hypothetical protein